MESMYAVIALQILVPFILISINGIALFLFFALLFYLLVDVRAAGSSSDGGILAKLCMQASSARLTHK